MDGIRSPLRGHRWAWTARWTCPGSAVRFPARNALDSDRRYAWRGRARYDRTFRVRPSPRENAWADGEGRNRRRCRFARAHQRARDHDHFDGRAGARRRAGAREKSVGRIHDRDDNSHRIHHGHRVAHGKSKRDSDHNFRISGPGVRRVGRTISCAFSRDRELVST